jgi:hypothetical protein
VVDLGFWHLLLRALHTGVATTTFLIIIAHMTLLGSCLLTGIHLGQRDLLDMSTLGESGQGGGRGEDRTKLLNLGDLGPVGGGELDIELNVQVAEIVVSLSGHTLTHDSLQITRLDDLTGENLDNEDTVIQVRDLDLATGKSSDQVNLGIVEQIIAVTLGAVVLLLLQDNDNITGDGTGGLITLAVEDDLSAIPHTTIDMNLKDLADGHDLASVTVLALVLGVDNLSLTTAVTARLLDLLHHRSHLTEHDTETLTVTGCAGLASTLLSTLTLTLFTENILLESELGSLALVEILE